MIRRVTTSGCDWPLYDRASSRRIEHQALAASAPHALMRSAGAAVAALARALTPHAQTIWIACGPGNNGGDGLEAAHRLHASGLKVEVSLLADPAKLPIDAMDAYERARTSGVSISAACSPVARPDLVIDALLGVGSSRAPAGDIVSCIDAINSPGRPVLSVDLPSGLNADTGQPRSESCVRATHTLALLTLKPGLFTGAGRDHAGQVWLEDLRVAPSHPSFACLRATPPRPRARSHAHHKGSYGDVAVVGGAAGMTGAAWLAARAAHAAGAGRVFVDLLDLSTKALDVSRPELMLRPSWWQSDAKTLKQSTVVCGCGGGEAVRNALPRVLALAGRLVLDADALNAVASDSALQRALTARQARGQQTVITPHPLEAARLLGTSTAAVQADRLAAAAELAQRFVCTVVLKGSGSVLAAPNELTSINATGNASLATAGTGDVLAGWIGGLWSAETCDAYHAAGDATWLHGHAADLGTAPVMRAADLVDAMLNTSADNRSASSL